MRVPFQRVLVLLLALLVIGASSEAALCGVLCASQAHCMGVPADASSMSSKLHQASMAAGDCASGKLTGTTHQGPTFAGVRHLTSCSHTLAWYVARDSGPDTPLRSMLLPVVDMLPMHLPLAIVDMQVLKDTPTYPRSMNPLSVSLRV